MSAILSMNQTPFPVLVFDHAFYHGKLFHCAVMKATYAIADDGALQLLEEQPGLNWNDRYWDEATLEDAEQTASLHTPSDLLPYKPRVDVLLTGHAHAPSDEPIPAWAGELRINHRKKRLILTGPRQWRHRALGGWVLGDAAPVSKVALRHELAYGGSWPPLTPFSELTEGSYCPDNPVGRGWFNKKNRPDGNHTYWHPQILTRADFDASPRIDKALDSVGFSPLPGTFWERLQKAGTYDAAWEKEHAPHIPLDMDLGFWNCAPADQQLDDADVENPETVEIGLLQLLPQRDVVIRLPDVRPYARVDYASGDFDANRMRLDTILIDLDQRQLSLRWQYSVAASEEPVSIKISVPAPGKT